MPDDDLFGITEQQEDDALQCAGCWVSRLFVPPRWQLPDGKVVTREEALEWLRRQREDTCKPS